MSKSWEEKRLFTEQVVQDVLSLDIAKVLSKRLNIKRKGYQYTALCPFHNDKHYGNFMISSSKSIYKCFACGAGGNSIKFVAEIEGLNFIQAAYKIALEERLISQEEYDENLTGRKYSKKEIQSIEMISIKSTPEVPVANNQKKHMVYQEFLNILKEEFDDGLKEDDWNYLIEERGLSKDIIQKRQYRSISYSQYMRQKISNKLMENLQIDDLTGIPGFYQEKHKGEWHWSFPGTKGILIPIMNAKGQIVALQIRKSQKSEDSTRYTWMSSAFAAYNEELFKNGSSPGAPLDVLMPDKVTHTGLFITEGRFKSEVILNTFNAPSISVQGVSSWKSIEDEINEIFNWMDIAATEESKRYTSKQIVIAYDSDMQFKYSVYLQLKNLVEHLKGKYPEISIKVALWDYNDDQKGIDDYIKILNLMDVPSIRNEIFFLTADVWIDNYEKEISSFIKKEGLINEWEVDPLAFRHYTKRMLARLKEQA